VGALYTVKGKGKNQEPEKLDGKNERKGRKFPGKKVRFPGEKRGDVQLRPQRERPSMSWYWRMKGSLRQKCYNRVEKKEVVFPRKKGRGSGSKAKYEEARSVPFSGEKERADQSANFTGEKKPHYGFLSQGGSEERGESRVT